MTCDKSEVFSGTLVSSTNKTDRHNISEILLKVILHTINISNMDATNLDSDLEIP